MTPTKEHAIKVLAVVDAGLCSGLGSPVPGQMCVEAAVCYALGEPHGDEPSCVGEAVRKFKIILNDANWSSNEARAKGMRRVAIAQLGSDQVSQHEFTKEVALQTVKQILPIALRAAASMIPSHSAALETAAGACEVVVDLVGARAAAYAAANAAAYAAADAADAARAAADAARDSAYAAARAAANAANAAYAAANAAAAYANDAARDSVFVKAAEIAVQALKRIGSAGCAWLDITE